MKTGTRCRTRVIARRLLVLGALLGPACGSAAPSTALFSADGYRIDDFRSPVPSEVPGATTVDTAQVQRLVERGDPPVVLIDVP